MERLKIKAQEIKAKLIARLDSLRVIWQYSDSQPTEITLAAALVILYPIATYLEIGFSPIMQLLAPIAGLYQLYCVSGKCLSCRVRASWVTFSFYLLAAVMYLYCGLLFKGPSYWGWILIRVSSFGSLKRIKKEELHRKNG
jgi:hypothetical protein